MYNDEGVVSFMLRMLIHGGGSDNVGPTVLDAMFRLRYRVFKERLGWQVTGNNGLERDRFDDLDPVYLILKDGDAVVGSVRLLRTTGPHMLRDVFGDALGGRLGPSGPAIWESTRFSVDMDMASGRESRHLSTFTSCLLSGIWEFGLAARLSDVVSVYDGRMARILGRAGCTIARLGHVRRPDGTLVIAGRFPVNSTVLERIRAVGGLTEPMLPQLTPRIRDEQLEIDA